MKIAFSSILVAALAITPSFGSLLEHQSDDLTAAIKGLTRDPDVRGWIQLSETGHKLQSVNGKGKVLDEIQLTAEQEAGLRHKFASKVAGITGDVNSSDTSTTREERSVLDKNAPGCADWASICDETADCYAFNCDDCFKINPIGVCYSYS